jgi:hypothetical protein
VKEYKDGTFNVGRNIFDYRVDRRDFWFRRCRICRGGHCKDFIFHLPGNFHCFAGYKFFAEALNTRTQAR